MTENQLHKLLHDLQGPVINARAFNNELLIAIEKLSAHVKQLDPENTSKHCVRLTEILNEDIIDCASHVGKALDTLQSRIDQLR